MEEYPFRFPLHGGPCFRARGLDDLLRIHLRELLDLLEPLEGDRGCRPDGYRLLSDRQANRSLYPSEDEDSPEPSDPLDLYEPRLGYIRRLLESLLGIIDLEADGERVQVDGFRLKDPDQWLVPCGGAGDILAQAASGCNLSCRFCYNKGATPVLRSGPRDPADEYQEILTRIKHYSPQAGLGLFPNMGSPGEALAHPYILDILRELRRKTSEAFRLSTNGSTLRPQVIRGLAELGPVYLDVSINSCSPERRKWLMNDPEPRIALGSLALLREAGIPYTVVIVPWPFPTVRVMLEDLRKTVAFAAGHDPTLIQVSLPGCSREVSENSPFPLDEVWNGLKKEVRELRASCDLPLVIRPGLFEEYEDPAALNDPAVVGVIKNSPADGAGLRRGDRIIKVNGLPIRTRPQARTLLTVLHQSEVTQASLSVERYGTRLDLNLDPGRFDYPYTPETATHLGAVFSSSGVPRAWIERLEELIASRGATEVLLLTSRLVRPAIEHFISRSGRLSNVNMHVLVPGNRYFGGNIFMGDLMVASDFVQAGLEFIDQEGVRPDLVVIPSSPFHLSGWSRDLTGRVYLEIERRLGVPVALVECDPIFD